MFFCFSPHPAPAQSSERTRATSQIRPRWDRPAIYGITPAGAEHMPEKLTDLLTRYAPSSSQSYISMPQRFIQALVVSSVYAPFLPKIQPSGHKKNHDGSFRHAATLYQAAPPTFTTEDPRTKIWKSTAGSPKSGSRIVDIALRFRIPSFQAADVDVESNSPTSNDCASEPCSLQRRQLSTGLPVGICISQDRTRPTNKCKIEARVRGEQVKITVL